MAKGQYKESPSLLGHAWKENTKVNFFSLPDGPITHDGSFLGDPVDLREKRIFSMTEWFQARLNQLSPTEKTSTLSICNLNIEKPFGTAFTVDMFMDKMVEEDWSGFSTRKTTEYVPCDADDPDLYLAVTPERALTNDFGLEAGYYKRETNIAVPRGKFSRMLNKLEELKVIRRADADECANAGLSDIGKQKVYVFSSAEFECWYRLRTNNRAPSPFMKEGNPTFSDLIDYPKAA